MRRAGSPRQLEQARVIAANIFDQGLGTDQIAASLAVDDQTVRRWRRLYRARGRDGLRSSKHSGRAPRLSAEQRQTLAGLLVKGRPRAGSTATSGPSN